MSRLELMVEPNVVPVRRVEVITGASGRRRWTDDEKARVVEETLQPDAVVSEIARRHGLTPQQLFAWRREARQKAAETSTPFVPAIMEGAVTAERTSALAPKAETPAAPVMEIEIGDAHVWIWRDADVGVATAIVRALQTTPRAK